MRGEPPRAIFADWSGEGLRRLAVALLADSLVRVAQGKGGVSRAFLTHPAPRFQALRRPWLAILTDDVEAAEAALARLLGLPEAELRARVAALTRLEPAARQTPC